MKAVSLLVILIIASACGREEPITRRKVPKEGAPAMGALMAAAPAAVGQVKWSTPKGWKETGASGMRRATLAPPGPGKAEATVVAFPGDAGGELANLNRWRTQIGLPAVAEKDLAAARARVASPAGPVAVYRLESADRKTKVVAGALFSGGMTWFFKLSGESAAVAAADPAFTGLLESLHAAR